MSMGGRVSASSIRTVLRASVCTSEISNKDPARSTAGKRHRQVTSWMATRSASFILSNSSMHTMPLSASTMAPASRRFSPACQHAHLSASSSKGFKTEELSMTAISRGQRSFTKLFSPPTCLDACHGHYIFNLAQIQ